MPETKLKPPYTTMVVKEMTPTHRVGVMKTSEWFKGEEHVLPAFMREGYVVAQWFEYENGQNIAVEGRHTFAACARVEDAMLIYKAHAV